MSIVRQLGVAAIACALLATSFVPLAHADPATLTPFGTDRALKAFVARHRAVQSRNRGYAVPPPPVVFAPAPPPPPPSPAEPGSIVVTGQKVEQADQASPVAVSAINGEPNITNRQEADIDEGGIVKVHGRHLVILRRGRLFTVSVADNAMRPVSHIDAYQPGTSGAGAWYDEMLVAGDRVIVIGYSYARGGTEINRFAIDGDGRLSYIDTHHLTSDDYYSSRNYASRLIGTRLIFYAPLSLDEDNVFNHLPGVRRWRGNSNDKFERIAPASNIYAAEPVLTRRDANIDTLHSVTTCDLAAVKLQCTATAILGSSSRTFYVSGKAVYVWVTDAFDRGRYAARSVVYRMPLDGSAPSAILAWGAPVDQFSFREDRADGVLNVLVRAEGGGDRMWRAEVTNGDIALLRLPIAQFGDGSESADRASYRALPHARGNDWSFQNRFVGGYLLYSGGELQERKGSATLFAVPLRGGPVQDIAVPHGIDRIDMMGVDGIAVGGGTDASLGFTAIELGRTARLGDTYRLPAASEGESRSQAYFFRSDSPDGATGLLGLPVSRVLGPTFRRFLGNGSAITFLGRTNRHFAPAGELEALAANARDDACQASCVDWYGNARPIFLGNRIFALMGYELVEGTTRDGRIAEVARTDFAPGQQ